MLCLPGLLATSYPPGHNSWPGAPFEWWIRGSLAFLLMAGPVVSAWLIAFLIARRVLRLSHWIAPLVLVSLFAFLANTLDLRDGDRPWFIGALWGQRVAAWLALGAILSVFIALKRGGDVTCRRGFEVVGSDDTSRRQAR
jgi:hypothetical protein